MDPAEKQIINGASSTDNNLTKQCAEENNGENLVQFETEETTGLELGQICEPYCRFIVGPEKKEIMANKILLSRQSKVFMNMFYGPLKTDNKIEIPDVGVKDFQTFLKFIDEKSVCFTNASHAIKILQLADMYAVIDLIRLASEYLYPTDVSKMWIALHYGYLYTIPLLKKASLKIVREETSSVLLSSQFPTIDYTLLIAILQEEYLNVESELVVINAALSWAKLHCLSEDLEPNQKNIRKLLKEAIIHIRFLTLTPKDIRTSCASLLTGEETQNIVNVLQGTADKSIIKPLNLSMKKRKRETNAEHPVLISVKFSNSPIQNHVRAQMLDTIFTIYGDIGLSSVTLHTILNREKMAEFYFENVTVHVCKSDIVIGEGNFTGNVKYCDSFKVLLFSINNHTIAPTLTPGSYSIQVKFNSKRTELNPTLVVDVLDTSFALIRGGYVIGVEYYLVTSSVSEQPTELYTQYGDSSLFNN